MLLKINTLEVYSRCCHLSSKAVDFSSDATPQVEAMLLDLDKVIQAVGKTGFKLEYEIGSLLRKNGWHLISNRCYIDDLEGTVREMDLLAYRVSPVKDFSLYTALIISCKKSEENVWALLSRAVEEKDPNYNWRPFKGWSDHFALNYYMSKMTWPAAYHERLSQSCPAIFSAPEVDVFAFQEISKAKHTSQNDRNIFSSITSLMKAQSYEISILSERNKKKKRAYQFNLISIIDSEIVRIFFDDQGPSAKLVDSEDYLCRYIVNEKEEVARIKFVTAKHFPKLLKEYEALHRENCSIFEANFDKFYADAYREPAKKALLLPDFNKLVKPALSSAKFRHARVFESFEDVGISWVANTKELTIDIDARDIDLHLLETFNNDEQLRISIGNALEKVFLYKGKFSFEIDIPF